VALAGYAVLYLACGSELEALFDAALGLQLGHFGLLQEIRIEQTWQPF
jgi:hypothetical protein